jgi:hypothetical protein
MKKKTSSIYKNKNFIVATMHKKEQALQKPFKEILGANVESFFIDTDSLGTFSLEIERKLSHLETAKEKCLRALKVSNNKFCISSEGSFGQDPRLPFLSMNFETLYVIDLENSVEFHVSNKTNHTNYCHESFSDLNSSKEFLDKALFPSHALIVKPQSISDTKLLFKSIQDRESLINAFDTCKKADPKGLVLIQTDMRAHLNPTRMKFIENLAQNLADRLNAFCPECNSPGFGLKKYLKGKPCEYCGFETEEIEWELTGCIKCSFEEKKSYNPIKPFASAAFCLYCNP